MTVVAPARASSTRARRFYQIPITPTDPPYDDDPQAVALVASPPAHCAAAPVVLALPGTRMDDPTQHGSGTGSANGSANGPRRPTARSGPVEAPNRSTPTARAVATVVVRAIVEAMTGIRPVAHLATWTSAQVQADLEQLAANNVRKQRYTLRCVRICEPREGIAEVAAVIARGERVSALALRMETSRGRWQVTALQTR
ncbi:MULTISPECIES: Rv3235 family protein [unclassified Frankia]|uniref:Rv3235 family protein n=1 Tax=unclassified Frankia TaxID=2632575 RepID=UPI002AD2223D|nr:MULTISPECIES: Rv3235 family protein [unclassified Frankia]